MKLSNFDVVLIGCGQMGSALIRGAVARGVLRAERVTLVDADPDKVTALAGSIDSPEVVPERGDRTLWIVAVKPWDVATALAEQELAPEDVVVSVAAGTTLATIGGAAGSPRSVVRAMPNTPALIGRGITGIYGEDDEAVSVVRELFEAVGDVVVLDKESQFDAVTAVSGSGPAYVFLAIEALADGGVLMGLGRETALRLAVATVEGAAALASETGDAPSVLKDRVASPGGTTIAGLEALESKGFRGALIAAVRAAAERSRALGQDD